MFLIKKRELRTLSRKQDVFFFLLHTMLETKKKGLLLVKKNAIDLILNILLLVY